MRNEVLVPTYFSLTGPIFAFLIFYGTMAIFPDDKASRHFLRFVVAAVIGYGLFVGAYVNSLNGTPLIASAIGFSLLVYGYMEAWRGCRAYFAMPPSAWPWVMVCCAIGEHMLLLLTDSSWFLSFGLMAGMAGLMYTLALAELILRRVLHARFSDLLLAMTLASLILSNFTRMGSALNDKQFIGPALGMPFAALAVNFILPMIASICVGAALILMHFNRLIDQITFIATHDGLTGLLNRRAAVESGEREVALARRERRALMVAFIDVDHFKKINDTYSHDQGDAVLRQMAQLLGQLCRKIDRVSRYGGEEFCVMFSSEKTPDPQAVGRKLVDGVRSHDFGLPTKVTVSVGIAIRAPDELQCDWHLLVDRADTLLYEAKEGGRDQFRIYAAPQAAPAIPGLAHLTPGLA
jgi:diguanylate cyclase (GGDEF)-like protein